MTKQNSETLVERGTLVRCMGGSGVVVASSRATRDELKDDERNMPTLD